MRSLATDALIIMHDLNLRQDRRTSMQAFRTGPWNTVDFTLAAVRDLDVRAPAVPRARCRPASPTLREWVEPVRLKGRQPREAPATPRPSQASQLRHRQGSCGRSRRFTKALGASGRGRHAGRRPAVAAHGPRALARCALGIVRWISRSRAECRPTGARQLVLATAPADAQPCPGRRATAPPGSTASMSWRCAHPEDLLVVTTSEGGLGDASRDRLLAGEGGLGVDGSSYIRVRVITSGCPSERVRPPRHPTALSSRGHEGADWTPIRVGRWVSGPLAPFRDLIAGGRTRLAAAPRIPP